MSYAAFLAQALLISLSGVLGPGPVTVVVVRKGARSPTAGALVALGHGAVEFPLMVLIIAGLGPILQNRLGGAIIGLAGGAVLLFMGAQILAALRRPVSEEAPRETSAFLAGVLTSAANPYFLVWWATVGATLVFRAWEFGFWPFALFAVAHWSLDLIWYFLLSAASYRGTSLLGRRFQTGVSTVCGILLLFFGVRFVADALAALT